MIPKVLATSICIGLCAPMFASMPTLPQVKVRPNGETAQTAGSAESLDAIQLRSAHVISTTEALRKLPGLTVRDEEGFGLRPNIGVRGLNPTRSTKVLLLEDGVPASYAPYGDNASYYHAPIERYERIELLKGAEMLRFGPQSISAVINYLTPEVGSEFSGLAELSAGSLGFRHAQTKLTGGNFLLDASLKRGDGSRDNTALDQRDVQLKWQTQLGESQGLSLKLSRMSEDSQVSYSGITDLEYQNFGADYNPFENDEFKLSRVGAQLGHRFDFSSKVRVETSVYASKFDRDWWRQSSTTTDSQCGSAFRDRRLAGLAVDVSSCNSTQGRLRSYRTHGIEPKLMISNQWFGLEGQFETGLRWHREYQDRIQENGTTATARSGIRSEDNRRIARARSAYIAQRMQWDQVSLFPIVRFESARFQRRNDLNGRGGSERISQFLPGLGVNYALDAGSELYFSAHRGFAPPRVEDLIDSNGGSVNVNSEDSRQMEFGIRKQFQNLSKFSLTAFQSDFLNQVAVGSIAGGGIPLAEGEALYRGIELSANQFFDFEQSRTFLEGSLTYLPVARQTQAFRSVLNNSVILGSASGLRMPYAPKQLASLRTGWIFEGIEVAVEAVHQGGQFADFANLSTATGNGQFGRIGGNTQFHANLNYRPEQLPFEVFIAVKNLTDKDYIADRTRGILLGQRRSWQIGLSTEF